MGKIYNPDFNVTEFSNIKNESGSNGFVLTVKQRVQKTNAIGITSKPGRCGGACAHKDIAFEFASWVSVEFKLYLIRKFQRRKDEELKQLGRDIKRNLVPLLINKLNQKLRGHYNYFGVVGNISALHIVYSHVIELLYKWLSRRSQKKSFTWDRLKNLLSMIQLSKLIIE